MTKLLVIDTETGGVDPEIHSILSIAAVVWEDGVVRSEIEILIEEPELLVTPRAMEINRIDLAAHARAALAPAPALRRLLDFADTQFSAELALGEQVVLAGHNVAFDVGFLRRLCRLAGAGFPRQFSHRTLDTASVLRFLSLGGRIPESAVASNQAFAQLGVVIAEDKRHTALGDARATAELLTRLIAILEPPRAPTSAAA